MTELPTGFVWGVSTSAFQIEGGTTAGGRGESIWDRFARQAGRVAGEASGEVATDHYHRFPEDVALLAELGVGAYRFSLSWPRLLPTGRGARAAEGFDFYDRLLDELLAARIRPWVCLYHWDLPRALQELGGWSNRILLLWFAAYAEAAAERFGDRVEAFFMLNEPNVHALLGHLAGVHAPGITDLSRYLAAIHHQNLAV